MPNDQAHAKAVKAVKSDIIPVTSSLIINETVSLLQARGFLSAAIEFLRETRSSPYVQVVHIDSVIQSDAWGLFVRYGGMGDKPPGRCSLVSNRPLRLAEHVYLTPPLLAPTSREHVD